MQLKQIRSGDTSTEPTKETKALRCRECGSEETLIGVKWVWCLKCESKIVPTGLQQVAEVLPVDWLEELVGFKVANSEEDEAIERVTPCSKCDSLELWKSVDGRWHCEHCEPRLDAKRWQRNLERIRRKSR